MKINKNILEKMTSFLLLRDEIITQNDKFMHRLFKLFELPKGGSSKRSGLARMQQLLLKVFIAMKHLMRLFFYIPIKWREVTVFLKHYSNLTDSEIMFFALSVDRLKVFENKEGIRSTLYKWTAPIKGEEEFEFRGKIVNDDYIFLFEPSLICNCKFNRKGLVTEKVVLMDSLFLFVLGFRKLSFKTKFNLLSSKIFKGRSPVEGGFTYMQVQVMALLEVAISFAVKACEKNCFNIVYQQ